MLVFLKERRIKKEKEKKRKAILEGQPSWSFEPVFGETGLSSL